jgi:hypothetical protein
LVKYSTDNRKSPGSFPGEPILSPVFFRAEIKIKEKHKMAKMSTISKKAMKLTLEQYLVLRLLDEIGSNTGLYIQLNMPAGFTGIKTVLKSLCSDEYIKKIDGDTFYITALGKGAVLHFRSFMGINKL